MNTAELINQFRNAAIEKGEFAPPESDAMLHRRMSVAYRKLYETPEGRYAFQALLQDSSPYVQSWTAAQLLSLGVHAARPVLEHLATLRGLTGISCRTTLAQFDMGKLGSPL